MKEDTITKLLIILFFTVSVVEIIGVAINNALLQMIFKPLIIPLLIALYWFSVDKRNIWYIIALVFSFLGDVFLLDKNNLFIFGIASFLITQILFITIIVKQMKKPTNFHKYLYAFLYANYVVYLIGLLKPNLGELLYPVIVYGIAIAIFALVATLNYVSKRNNKTLILMFGAILFVASDSMIALYKFHQPQSIYPVAIMTTYILAQYFIYKFMAAKKSS